MARWLLDSDLVMIRSRADPWGFIDSWPFTLVKWHLTELLFISVLATIRI